MDGWPPGPDGTVSGVAGTAMLPGMPVADTPDTWTDFSGLARMRAQAAKHDPAALRKVASEFEAVFLYSMLKSMRQAMPGDPLFSSASMKGYYDLLDHQLAQNIASRGGVGLADMLVRQIAPIAGLAGGAQTPGVPARGAAAMPPVLAPPATGGTAPTGNPGSGATATAAHTSETAAGGASAAADAAPGTPAFDSPQAFVAAVWPDAQRAGRALGVPPEALVAQAALETGWGAHVMRGPDGRSSNNLFGIKADARWQGPSVNVSTLEYQGGVMHRVNASFRAYPSIAASFDDYAKFVASQPRYRDALANAPDAAAYIQALHTAGYATDPDYARKVIDVMQRTVLAVKSGAPRSL